ncbi:MAG: hypothetical protein AAF663_12755 [Planctomycetota bacterium]
MSLIRRLPDDRLLAPSWLDGLCPEPQIGAARDGISVGHENQGGMLRVSATLEGAVEMEAEALEQAVEALYAQLFRMLNDVEHPYLLRVWNGLPGIGERICVPADRLAAWESEAPVHEPFDRYMAFNAGRSKAFETHFGHDGIARLSPAATAVGHLGHDLQVHLLASDQPGQAIENPRQVPSYRYSQRFGPRPPVFVRATRFGERLLISGTASIVGQDSVHPDQVHAQFEETLNNLRTITKRSQHPDAALQHFRIYAPHDEDLPQLASRLNDAYPQMRSLELMRSDICRKNLLVEIEAAT